MPSEVIVRDRDGNIIEILPATPDIPIDPNYIEPPIQIDIEQRKEEIIAAIQWHLDAVSHTRGYDNILSLCTYATSSIPQFKLEGQAGVDFRDACWGKCYQIMVEFYSGNRSLPTIEGVLSEMPEIGWS